MQDLVEKKLMKIKLSRHWKQGKVTILGDPIPIDPKLVTLHLLSKLN